MIGPLAFALGLAFAAPASQGPHWSRAWDELERASGMEAGAERADVLAPLRRLAGERAFELRGRLLAASIERLEQGAATLAIAPEELGDFDARESWIAARVAAPGPGLDRALAQSLAGLEGAELAACYQLAYERFLALANGYETESAIGLAHAIHARARAVWSASNLASALRRAGRWDEAHAVLSAAIAAPIERRDRAALLQERALVDAGAGWKARERDDLGASLARGSSDAAQVLGRLDLAAGRFDAARAVFRSALRDEPTPPWALRGWGLSMLPRARERL